MDTIWPARPGRLRRRRRAGRPGRRHVPLRRGAVEMAVVRLSGAFGGRRLLSLAGAWNDGYGLRTPFAAWQVEDAPQLSGGRHGAEDSDRARGYWLFEEP